MASEIYPFVEIVDYPARFAPDGTQADALREVARDRVRERLLLIERVLAGPFLLPGGFSMLDIYAAMFSRWSVGHGLARSRICRVSPRWRRLCRTAPTIAPVWSRHFERRLVYPED